MASGCALARAAERLVGTPFRLQGREPAHGLDCLGLVIASLAELGIHAQLPADYRPQRRRIDIPHANLRAAGLIEAEGPRRAGDILLLRTTPVQAHAAIIGHGGGIVHAQAQLGRVVASPLPDHWPIIAAWRIGPQTLQKGDTTWQR